MLLTPETEGALALRMELPSLTGFALSRGPGAEGLDQDRVASWISRWEASWLMDPLEGHQVRTEVYDDAMAPLARAVDPGETRAALRDVAAASRLVDDATLRRLPLFYRVRVEEARRLVVWGEGVLAAGNGTEALRAAFEAADRMRTVNPLNVATELLNRAALARRDMDGTPSTRGAADTQRVDRLIRGAETALEEGDFHRAILRAYYACRLLGVRLA